MLINGVFLEYLFAISAGGNPDRVTIFGQSAGAVSVAIHTYLPSSKGLFSQAMMIRYEASRNQ